MKLDKNQSIAYVKQNFHRQNGSYNPSRYVLDGWIDEKEESVLRDLIIKAHAEKVTARKNSQESHELKTGRYLNKHDQKPGHGIDKATGIRKEYLRSPRWSISVPELMIIGDGVFVRTNCKLNGKPVMVDANEALRKFQPRRLP